MSDSLLLKKTVCVITGPTKGLGRSITKALSSNLPEGSLFILLSRNEQLLKKIEEEVSIQKGVHAVREIFHQDSDNQDLFDSILQRCLDKAKHLTDVSSFEQAILVNNAGSLEPLDFARNIDSLETVSKFLQLNLVGSCVLTAKFLQAFDSTSILRVIVNISSLAAISPMKSWSLYNMAKAARDMQMKVIGQEETNIRTLNYAPGPLQTEMTEVAAKATKDPELKKWFNDSIKDKKLVECDDSSKALLKILTENSFENGDHVDFYDVK